MRVNSGIISLSASLFLAATCVFADPVGSVHQIVSFGDSLSDSGNASIATLGTEPGVRGPGYYYRSVSGVPFPVGEFTNAPTPGGPTGVWVDQLAPKLGLPAAQPALALTGGTNFAVASAVTGSGSLADVGSQITDFGLATGGKAPSNALYTIWAGANDIFNITNPANAKTTALTAADNLYGNILTLSSEGARYFIWANLPDLGKTPGSIAAGPGVAAVATAASLYFDGEWAADILKLRAAGISVIGLDTASLFAAIEANPSQYGFTNIDTAAITVPGADPNNYLFWDAVHPTAAADTLLADAAFADFIAAPEPAALGLAGLGFCALFLAASRARRKQQA